MPSEIFKPKSEVVVGSHSSNQIVKETRKRGGMKYFAVGFEDQLMRDGIFYACSLDPTKCLQTPHVPLMSDELNEFLLGEFAGMVGRTMAMPFDVPKMNV